MQSRDAHGGPGRWVNALSYQGQGRAYGMSGCSRPIPAGGVVPRPAAVPLTGGAWPTTFQQNPFDPPLSDPAPRWNPDPPVSSVLSQSRN